MLNDQPIAVGGKVRRFVTRAGNAGDDGAALQVFVQLDYNLEPFARHNDVINLHRVLRAGKVTPLIIDAGAHIGASAVFFACAWEGSHVVALEPEPNNCTLLRQNTAGLQVDVLQAGIASTDGSALLEDPGRSSWGFRLDLARKGDVRVYGASTIVSTYCRKRLVPFIFKCDIEGSEGELFRQNTDWMNLFPLIVIELHDWMLPKKSVSRSFFREIAAREFDVVQRGENLFCFNNRLL